MLQATIKLCCGIAHDHLQRLPGLKITAVAAIQKGVRGLVGRGSCHLPSKIPCYIQRVMGKETGWKIGEFTGLKRSLDAGTSVSSTALQGLGKVFRVEVVLAVPVAQLHRELFERIEQMPQWNPTLSQVKVLQRVGPDTLVTHEVTAPSPGNLVGQRDFVSVRHRGRRETGLYLVGTATHLEPLPSHEGCIRAESRLSCIVLQPLAEDPSRTRFTWLLSMDLKASATLPLRGWIPASIVNRVLPQSQADFIKHLRQHLSTPQRPEGEGLCPGIHHTT
ncbi:steroidogenic acute regulatory protein, mitochondrial-like [Porphyrio hochstetteri]